MAFDLFGRCATIKPLKSFLTSVLILASNVFTTEVPAMPNTPAARKSAYTHNIRWFERVFFASPYQPITIHTRSSKPAKFCFLVTMVLSSVWHGSLFLQEPCCAFVLYHQPCDIQYSISHPNIGERRWLIICFIFHRSVGGCSHKNFRLSKKALNHLPPFSTLAKPWTEKSSHAQRRRSRP